MLINYGNQLYRRDDVAQTFQCTRHATSCNNIGMGKFSLKGFADSEPALSAYGITEAIKLAQINKENKSSRFLVPIMPDGMPIPIAVSNLIRTWETAVLLYGYNLDKPLKDYPVLNLRVCPWLKETGWVGNEPKPLKHSIPKFLKFLNTLYNRYDPNHTNYNIKQINIYVPPSNTGVDQPYETLPSGDTNSWQVITITLQDGKYVVTNLCNITDTLYKRYGYQDEEGDLMEFMKWYTERFPYSPITMHIVAHSHIMQAFTKKYLASKVSENTSFENCWTITIPYYSEYNQQQRDEIMSSIQPGFKNPDKYKNIIGPAKDMERYEETMSLCGDSGSVEEFSCSLGGRRTRRKRSNRKKTRRNRRYSRHRR
jgi:hypothetical protein